MATANMPLAFGAILTGGWLLDKGAKNVKAGLSSSSTSTGGGGGGTAMGTVPSTPSGGYSPTTWAKALLVALGAPLTQANISSIVAWEGREGGNWNNSATFNPLNTTQTEPGSSVMGGGSSAGVQAYTTWAQGLTATIKTLLNGNYGDIVAALRSGSGLAHGSYAGLSTWSNGGYSSV